MKSKGKKITALVLCGALVLSTAVTAVFAANNDTKKTTATEEKKTIAAVQTGTVSKDETVYIFSGPDGKVHKVLVNAWLENKDKAASITDTSTLSDIVNVKGDETFTNEGSGKLVWDAKGQDIYYQGTTDQETPVQMSIRYTLDGKEIAPQDLAGKSGKVTIRFDYKNSRYEEVEIGGKKEKIYVPFLVLTGTMLDTDVFHNVEVTNGKMENLGNQIAVAGIAMPGMQENLAIDQKDLEIPTYLEIKADVENFEMSGTMTLATTALFNNMDSDKIDLEDLTSSMDKLESGANQLTDGSKKLYEGLNTLLEQSKILVGGIDQLYAGAGKLQSGAQALGGGASQLQSGTAQLSQGLGTLNSNSAALNGGAEQVFNTLLGTANAQLKEAGLQVPALTISNYAEVLNGVIASLDKDAVYQQALEQVTAAVEAKRQDIADGVTEAVKQQVVPKVTAVVEQTVKQRVTAGVRDGVAEKVIPIATHGTMTKETYDAAVAAGKVDEATQAAINAAIDQQMATEEVQKLIAATFASQMESDAVKGQIDGAVAQQMASQQIQNTIAENVELKVKEIISEKMASPEVQAKLQAAAEGAKAIISLKTSLDSYNSFYLGLRAYTSGVASAAEAAKKVAEGAGALKGGLDQLNTGVNELYSGVGTMKEKAPALISGVTQLRDGSKSLADGLNQMMEEGIQKLLDLTDKDLPDLADRITASIDAAKRYQSFSGIQENTQGAVKFIYKTDAVSAEDAKN